MRLISSSRKPVLYLPPQLESQLKQINGYPLTLVEGAPGFGKTTGLHYFFEVIRPAKVYKFSFHTLSVRSEWQRFCESLEELDQEIVRRLLRLDFRVPESWSELIQQVRTITCSEPVYILVDNLERSAGIIPDGFVKALSLHDNENLHLILLSSNPEYFGPVSGADDRINYIKQTDLVFDQTSVREYYKRNGIRLQNSELDQVYRITGGWISAMNVQRLCFLKEGCFIRSDQINQMLQQLIWDDLSRRERDQLYQLSVFPGFTALQAAKLLDRSDVVQLEAELRKTAFLHYDRASESYVFETIFREFLDRMFEVLPPNQKKAIKMKQALVYQETNNRFEAFCIYQDLAEYQAMLALELNAEDFFRKIDKTNTYRLEAVPAVCPPELLMSYPQTVLNLAFELFILGSYQQSQECCNIIAALLEREQNNTLLSLTEQENIAGQLAFVNSFFAFNDIEQMSRLHRQAQSLLKAPPKLYVRTIWSGAWLMGQPSVLYLFWNQVGGLDQIAASMNQSMPCYYELTGGHGMGAAQLLKGEIMLARGDDKAAETAGYEAHYLAWEKRQDDICYGSDLLLLRCSVLRGDIGLYSQTVAHMQQQADHGNDPGGVGMAGLCRAFEPVLLGGDEFPEWLGSIDRIQLSPYHAAIPWYMIIYFKRCICRNELTRMQGIIRALLPVVEAQHFILPKLYYYIFLTINHERSGNHAEAEKMMAEVLAIAAADRVYLPLAEHYDDLRPCLARLPEGDDRAQIVRLGQRYQEGKQRLIEELTNLAVRLTAREFEVAELARSGLTNREIAERLFISIDTVKVLLKHIFKKLNIQSRKELKYKTVVD